MNLDSELVPIDDVQPHPDNVRQGDIGAICVSLEEHGQYRTIVVQRSSGYVLAGNHTWKAAKQIGYDDIWVTYVDVDDDEALRILLVDNRTNDLAMYDDPALTEMLLRLSQTSRHLEGTGFDRDDLDEYIARLEQSRLDPSTAVQRVRDKQLSDIDLIFTGGSSYGKGSTPVGGALGMDEYERVTWGNVLQVMCCVAIKSGWSYGIQSSKLPCGGARIWVPHRPMFIDNEFKDYDHEMHVEYVGYWKPKYATVRDAMTEKQCEEIDVPYYSIDEILGHADEILEAGAQRAIVIPKYDCFDAIPQEHVIGFSVPTTYGGSMLPIEKFEGRDVHLLGGSPQIQIAYIDEFDKVGARVVSLDNNYLMRVAKWGTFWTQERPANHLDSVGLGPGALTNHLYVSMAISLGTFAQFFQRDVEQDDVDDTTREGEVDAADPIG